MLSIDFVLAFIGHPSRRRRKEEKKKEETSMQDYSSSPRIHGSAHSESIKRGPFALRGDHMLPLAFNTNAYYEIKKDRKVERGTEDAAASRASSVRPKDIILGLGTSKGRSKNASVVKNLAEDAFGKVKKIRCLGMASNQI